MSKIALSGNASGTGTFTIESPNTNTNYTLTLPESSGTIATGALLPPGSVIWYAANTPPTGYLKANGDTVSRTTYAALFAAIGTTFGAGDGSTTFKLPDLRGEFVRGWDDGRGVDSGRVFGSNQSQDVQPHSHTLQFAAVANPASTQISGSGSFVGGTTISATQNSTGTETRPRNVALLACIKF